MPTWALIVLIVLAVIALLAIGGAIANQRRRGDIRGVVDEANRHLAAAHAADKGWEPKALNAAARQAFEDQNPGVEIREQALIQVIDRPGTDEDKAVFRFETSEGERLLTVGREDNRWVPEPTVR